MSVLHYVAKGDPLSPMRLPAILPGLILFLTGALAGQQVARRPLTQPELEFLVRRDSNDATVHYQLAMAYWDRKKWDDAERHLREAIALAPSYADAHLALGLLPEHRGEGYWKERIKREGEERVKAALLESASHYRRAFLLNPLVDLRLLNRFEGGKPGVYVAGNIIYFTIVPWWSAELVKSGNDMREGRYEGAFARLQALVADRRFGGEDVNVASEVLWFHGLTAAHLNRFDMAIRDFGILTGRSFAAEQDSTRVETSLPFRTNDYRFLLATMLYLGGRPEQAIPTFQRALQFDLGLDMAHVQLARMHESAGDLDQALLERRRALDASPDAPDLLIDLAGTLLKMGRLAEAQEPLEAAARLNPRDARIPYLQATVAQHLGHPDSAREAYSRFLAIAPSRFAEQIAEARQALATLP